MTNKGNCMLLRRHGGFTLTELIIVMAIMAVTVGAIYGVYISSNHSYRTQDRVVAVQQTVRASADFMIREIRLAGLDPLSPAIDATDTNGAGIKEATSTKLRFTADMDMDGTIEQADEERITYEYIAADRRIRRILYEGTPSASSNNLTENITAMTFNYLDADGNTIAVPVAAADLDTIRTIVISITGQDVDSQGQTFTRTLTTRAICRNLY
ncbi:MAG TPA: prepilin-type N-terminal cleavage/methylation domain-containing protein [Deltaproteobacteria bacterium]|nr:prepilin-type N-terminal cleavage/methylation domain-containing protein [Deltaproteobacteria bacterium]